MEKSSKLTALFEAGAEPTHTAYKVVTEILIQDPEQLTFFAEDNVKIHLRTDSRRLARLFRLLRSSLPPPQSQKTGDIAVRTSDLLIHLLPDLHQLLAPRQVIDVLVPALEVCFVPPQPRGLRALASELSSCGTLLEYLAAEPSGSDILRQWVGLPRNLAPDVRDQAAWAERLANMVLSCIGNHGVAPAIRHWADLNALKDALRRLESKLLGEEGKKPHRPPSSLALDEESKRLLESFGLVEPASRRMVQRHIDVLSNGQTSTILRSIVDSFPCKQCIPGLGTPSRSINAEIHEEKIEDLSDLGLDVLGKAVGMWKVLLSGPALKSIQTLSRLGLFGPVQEKLTSLASGSCLASGSSNTKLAGSAEQRKQLKVPLASTKCGRNLFVLWQVSVGVAGERQAPQQVIIVWEVGNSITISKALERAILLHRSYSKETMDRSRQRPATVSGVKHPVVFNDYGPEPARLEIPSAVLDIRTVDQGTIEMAARFYVLTRPVIRSIIANDLAAELPFDLSTDEARCVAHFQTASLILGRSGTGKTTCLVFKLVGKFLASKQVSGGKPARQVLLTRSSFLADKLGSYTRRLIETLSSESFSSQSFRAEEHPFAMAAEEDRDSDSVLTLNDQSFPLICTWDHFLRLLENTALALDRQNFSEKEEADSSFRHEVASTRYQHPPQLVDFYAFKLDYWPRFPQTYTKGLSVHLVFAEIMGVIKGSESSRESLVPLSREDYLKRSSRLAPSFALEAERSRVYDVFESYQAMKCQYQDFDYVDRVVKILAVLRRDSSLMQILRATFDEVYIDEVQDQRCLDLELLLNIVRDGRGFHFAGDTAQAISQDSTFRFADVKKMLFDHFAFAGEAANQHQLGHAKMFTLSKNYRSHQGILTLASLIMEMIWNGFPETVDKLEPEVGNLSGPKPVLFIGCDTSILRSSTVASGKLSERSADFGAEQVILVRDPYMKANLQDKIGDVVLIFTILESKGMEFDDVILWNFFSECPDQPGIRSLTTLHNDSAIFDSKKNSGMCSELKHFYVAVTRARIQLFIVESSEDTAASVLKLLTPDASAGLVDITRPGQNDFSLRVEMMRPSTSVDPAGWARRADDLMQRRMFKEALMPFRRAGDRRGEAIALGFLKEEEGRFCQAKDDMEGFTRNLEVAFEHFLEVKLIGDAVRVLVTLGNLEKAAGVWLEHNNPLKAAALFSKSGHYLKAHECYHVAREYTEAAAMLQVAKEYDRLVLYLDNNRQSIPVQAIQGYRVFCKLLLKQKKLSFDNRKHATKIIGCQEEQEACFREYGMDEDLAELFNDQQRYRELYYLYSRNGQLGKALEIALANNLLQLDAQISEAGVLQLLDYLWAFHLGKRSQESFANKLRTPSVTLTPKMLLKVEQWEAVQTTYMSQETDARKIFASPQNTMAELFVGLQKILDDKAINRASSLDNLGFEMMHEAVEFTKGLVLNKNSEVYSAVLLLAGVWKPPDVQHQYLLLPWSPLRGTVADVGTVDMPQITKQWVLGKLALAIQALDLKARDLWSLKWPTRCITFLTRGFCPQHRLGQCQRRHERVSESDCFQVLEDLLRVNRFFCDLAVIYYRSVMNEMFQKRYLGMRRFWLERLLRELTFLSSVEQSASAISSVQEVIFRGGKSLVISSSLEGLLYFRLRNEWSTRSSFTSLLEQMQVSEVFGPNVQNRLFRALSHALHQNQRSLLQRHLALLSTLIHGPERQLASTFQSNLNKFLRDLDHIRVQELSTLHSIIAAFECLAVYLTLKSCGNACLLTQAWVDLYLPRIKNTAYSHEPVPWEQSYAYKECLMELAKRFCYTLRCLNEAPQSNISFLCSGTNHPPALLRQRNAEMVAIIVTNLAATLPAPKGMKRLWDTMKEVFGYDFIRAQNLISSLPDELHQKLARSFSTYDGKDGLLVVVRDRNKGHALVNLERQPGVKTITLSQLCPCPPASEATNASADVPTSSNPPPPAEASVINEEREEYTQTEMEKAVKLQQWWRAVFPCIASRRTSMSTSMGQAITRFVKLGGQFPNDIRSLDRTTIRRILHTDCIALSFRVTAARESLHKLQKDSMECVEHVELSQGGYESVDEILGRIREAESQVKKAAEMMDDDALALLVKGADPQQLERIVADVDDLLEKAEQAMLETRLDVDGIAKGPA